MKSLPILARKSPFPFKWCPLGDTRVSKGCLKQLQHRWSRRQPALFPCHRSYSGGGLQSDAEREESNWASKEPRHRSTAKSTMAQSLFENISCDTNRNIGFHMRTQKLIRLFSNMTRYWQWYLQPGGRCQPQLSNNIENDYATRDQTALTTEDACKHWWVCIQCLQDRTLLFVVTVVVCRQCFLIYAIVWELVLVQSILQKKEKKKEKERRGLYQMK